MNEQTIRVLKMLAAKQVKHNQVGIEVDSVPVTKLSAVFDFDMKGCEAAVNELVSNGFAGIKKQAKGMPYRVHITEKGRSILLNQASSLELLEDKSAEAMGEYYGRHY